MKTSTDCSRQKTLRKDAMDYGKATLDELKRGYYFKEHAQAYVCSYCKREFPLGHVFSVGENFLVPERAADQHVYDEHGGSATQLITSETKYNTLTDKQKELLTLFAADLSDAEIATKLDISPSTVRHQKFTFREKAKQARLYLAQFESVFEGRALTSDSIVPVHSSAPHIDDRYVITEGEKARILELSFSSLEPLRLKAFPPKEKKKVVILATIAECFEPGRHYSEKEVTQILAPIYEDYVSIRRYLIMYGFMQRSQDGSAYWLA